MGAPVPVDTLPDEIVMPEPERSERLCREFEIELRPQGTLPA